MKKILTSRQMKKCDMLTIFRGTPSVTLMERAARSVFDNIMDSGFCLDKVLVVCGSGNNGGDGLLVAKYLYEADVPCNVWYVGEGHTMSEETEELYLELSSSEIEFVESPNISEYTLIVDAILGTGLSFPAQGLIKDAINVINDSDAHVVAVDIPSGISSDTGAIMGCAVCADMTVAIQEYKRGHFMSDGVDASGKVICTDIGIKTEEAFNGADISLFALCENDLHLIPKRKRSSHKGEFGRVLIIAGSKGMSGAAYLSAMAAYRSGAGLVEIFTHEANRQILQSLIPEAIVTVYDPLVFRTEALYSAMERASVIVIGPGMGTDTTAVRIVEEVFEHSMAPLIVDADALNIKAREQIPFPNDVPVIVTPHPLELSRLTGINVKELSRDTVESALKFARENDVICVSKFARTVITDGESVFVNMSGGPSLSKGGSGDVLTGVIAGMLCSDLSPLLAASIGAYVHGAAGDISAKEYGEYSPLARDVLDSIPLVLRNAGGKSRWQ